MQTINPLERAIIDLARGMTKEQLSKRIPDIPQMDYRRLIYCLIEDRIAAYKAAHIKQTLDDVLMEFGITSRQTYYNWYEKYHSSYQALKKNQPYDCLKNRLFYTILAVLLHRISGVTDPNGQTGVEPLDRQALVIIFKLLKPIKLWQKNIIQ